MHSDVLRIELILLKQFAQQISVCHFDPARRLKKKRKKKLSVVGMSVAGVRVADPWVFFVQEDNDIPTKSL